MTQFEGATEPGAPTPAAAEAAAGEAPHVEGPAGEAVAAEAVAAEVPAVETVPAELGRDVAASASPVAAALAELESLRQRELVDHPEAYQRIHAELQSALATIDDA